MHCARSAFLGRPRDSDLPLLIPDEAKATELPAEDKSSTDPTPVFLFDQLILDRPYGIVERSPVHAERGERDGTECSPAALAPDALAQPDQLAEIARELFGQRASGR